VNWWEEGRIHPIDDTSFRHFADVAE